MTQSEYRPAGLIVRLMALLYDLFLLFAVGFVYSGLVMIIVTALGAEATDLSLSTTEQGVIMRADEGYQPLLHGPLFQIGLAATVLAFYLGFWRWRDATLGMQTWRLTLVTQDGKKPNMKQLWIRSLTGFLAFACFGLGYFYLLIDPQKRALHDRVSGTRVVREYKS